MISEKQQVLLFGKFKDGVEFCTIVTDATPKELNDVLNGEKYEDIHIEKTWV